MKKLVISGLLLAAAISGAAAEAPLWLRNVAISPDGSTVAFTYKGDIYTVPATGGRARQITTSPAYDTAPSWSPDGSRLLFASTRDGGQKIYVIPADGGTATVLSTGVASARPLGWLDGETVLFVANMQPAREAAQGAFQAQVYTVSADGLTRPRMYMSLPAGAMSVDPRGRVLYQDRKGYEDPLRKHERSSGTSDIWLLEQGKYTRLTDFNGQDQNPVWAPDGQSFFYTTELSDGTMNVHRRTLSGSDTQITRFADHPVRSLSASADGTLAFSWNGEIYT
ncbi:MAG: peptidase S41, partial [Muribaculaceae bacterium]|nr:peptidase S41 [Muribaculaceae bacterium]